MNLRSMEEALAESAAATQGTPAKPNGVEPIVRLESGMPGEKDDDESLSGLSLGRLLSPACR